MLKATELSNLLRACRIGANHVKSEDLLLYLNKIISDLDLMMKLDLPSDVTGLFEYQRLIEISEEIAQQNKIVNAKSMLSYTERDMVRIPNVFGGRNE